ncbi:MAG: hypothetical protein HY926_05385 [Elusimicrobia bacterium]|nr:hypothetical protein [Elusimicrobiota bacterium]
MLSLALVLVSPGRECYAGASASVNTPTSETGSPTAGKTGVSGVSLIQVSPNAIQLSPASLSGSLKVMSAAPAVSEAGKTAPIAIPSAGQIVLAAAPTPIASSILLAAPQADKTETPVAMVSAQIVLQAGVEKISQAKDPTGKARVLDTVFTGSKIKAESADIVAPGAPDQIIRSGLKPASPEFVNPFRVPRAQSVSALAKTRIYLTRADLAPVVTTLAELPQALAADPSLKDSLNQLGRVRLIVAKNASAGNLTEADAKQVNESLRGMGVTAKFEVEKIHIEAKPAPKAEPAAPAPSAGEQKAAVVSSRLWRYLLGPVTWPFRQLGYLAKTLYNAYTAPTTSELIGGVVSKTVPTIMTIGVWGAMYTGHPIALAAALAVSIGLNVFHGLWINTWSNFQNKLGREKGLNYQSIFNLVYGQFWGALFRFIAWTALPNTVPPWSLQYWKDMGMSTVIGSFFGSLGYQGLNTLYDNGRISRWQRSAIQQVRDLFFTLTGVFFGSGGMPMFWATFAVQQTLDLLIYLVSIKAKRRPIMYMADEAVAASAEFQGSYPVGPEPIIQPSPIRQALKNLLDLPFVKPFVWLAKKLYGLIKDKK